MVITILIVGMLGWWITAQQSPSSIPHQAASTSPTVSTPPATDSAPQVSKRWLPPVLHYDTYASDYGPLPASLNGTQIPFFLQVDEHGQLIVNDALRVLFDYFFTTTGEEPLDTTIARIRELLDKQLPSPAKERAQAILDQYIALKKAEDALRKQLAFEFEASGRKSDLNERARLLQDLRATHLDQEAYQAFFGDEEKRDEYTLKRLEIMRDDSLSEEQRATALDTIEALLPPSERDAVRAQRETESLTQRVAQARMTGASDAQIFQMRESVYGAETAERFANADQQQSQWDARVSTYREQRASILNSAGVSDADKEQQIAALRAQHFDALEQKRIPTIDRMLDSKQP